MHVCIETIPCVCVCVCVCVCIRKRVIERECMFFGHVRVFRAVGKEHTGLCRRLILMKFVNACAY